MDEIIVRSAACPENPWSPWIALIPPLIWAGLLIGFAGWIGRDTIRSLLKRVDKVNIGGVELQLRDDLEAAAVSRNLDIAAYVLGRAARRLACSSKLTEGAKLLWVDDVPDSIVKESRLLEQAGALITRALSTTDALDKINKENFDLILSDIKRDGDDQAGIKFANKLAERKNPPPIVFYVGTVKSPPPQHAFGITNRPDELLHLVLDSLARSRS
ncbi:response regulator [Dyella humi]|uniref:Response regulator n=1 Tax=Dyella humi TaxID=1770547 RepID=A0ABW8IHV6_9GAMM